MILIETKQCSDALDARRIEREHVEQLHASLNRCLPGRTKQEYEKRYGEEHKEQIRERKKQYAETHKDQRADYWKRYYEEKKELRNQQCTCDVCGGIYTTSHKARHLKTIKHQRAIDSQLSETREI